MPVRRIVAESGFVCLASAEQAGRNQESLVIKKTFGEA